jgi:hypothetical protein
MCKNTADKKVPEVSGNVECTTAVAWVYILVLKWRRREMWRPISSNIYNYFFSVTYADVTSLYQ